MYYKSLLINGASFDVGQYEVAPFDGGDLAHDSRDPAPAPDHTAAQTGRITAYRLVFKRILDILLVALTAPIVVLVVVFLAAFVALEGGSPFYFQQRVGFGGRIFRMWKLRSMVPDADARFEAYLTANPEARREWDINQKLAHDPRITRVGRILRKTSLDELPQLWNVLLGDMSLVGPRPMMPCQQELYPGQAYYRLLPGITGPWQVSKRNQSTFADRANYDQGYENTLSLATDISLLFKTVRVVLHGTGC